jgi:hypothetical protein
LPLVKTSGASPHDKNENETCPSRFSGSWFNGRPAIGGRWPQ